MLALLAGLVCVGDGMRKAEHHLRYMLVSFLLHFGTLHDNCTGHQDGWVISKLLLPAVCCQLGIPVCTRAEQKDE